MADEPVPPSFDDFRHMIEAATAEERDACIERFIAHLLDPHNEVLRRIARREFFDQLRPLYTVEDVVTRVAQKLHRRLRSGKLRLLSEKKFHAYVTRMTRLILLDVNRLKRLPLDPNPLGPASEGGRDVPAGGKTPSGEVREAEDGRRLREVLREVLQPDEWYLIRRHYFEGASYAEIAAEVLPHEPGTSPGDKNPEDRIRMRIKRIRDELCERHEELADFLPD
jgi:RNA polymerase sigma factor (sigma-70 family)